MLHHVKKYKCSITIFMLLYSCGRTSNLLALLHCHHYHVLHIVNKWWTVATESIFQLKKTTTLSESVKSHSSAFTWILEQEKNELFCALGTIQGMLPLWATVQLALHNQMCEAMYLRFCSLLFPWITCTAWGATV